VDRRRRAGVQEVTMPDAPKVDLRILQANERTLLAWVRTGLALMAFGFVLARIGVWLEADGISSGESGASNAAGVAFIVLGTLCHPLAAARFVRARRAIVDGRDHVPDARTPVGLALGVTTLGAVMVGYLLLR
jgi:putative membrane protein